MSISAPFRNQQGMVISPSMYLKMNTPAIKFPEFKPPKPIPAGASYVGFITAPASKLTLEPKDYIAQPKDTFGMEIQEYFSARESYLRTMGIVQQILARNKAQYEAELQLLTTRQLYAKAREIRRDVRGLTENMALRLVNSQGAISSPAQLQRNDINALVASSMPTRVPQMPLMSEGASSKSLPQALAEAETEMGGSQIGSRQQDVRDMLQGIASASSDKDIKQASDDTASALDSATPAPPEVLDQVETDVGRLLRANLALPRDADIQFETIRDEFELAQSMVDDEAFELGIPRSATPSYKDAQKLARRYNSMARTINRQAGRTLVEEVSPLGGQIIARGRRRVMQGLRGEAEPPKRAVGGSTTITEASTYSNPLFQQDN